MLSIAAIVNERFALLTDGESAIVKPVNLAALTDCVNGHFCQHLKPKGYVRKAIKTVLPASNVAVI